MQKFLRRAVVWYSIRNRRRKAALISDFMRDRNVVTVIFSGVGSGTNNTEDNEAVVETALLTRGRILAAYDIRRAPHPGWPAVQADGRAMPFRDNAADLVVSNAVIEHVGDAKDQRRFIAEQSRVALNWVVTTPNKWFPIESHTSVLFKHWSPRWRGERDEFTRLLSLSEFKALLPVGSRVVGRPWSATFTAFSD